MRLAAVCRADPAARARPTQMCSSIKSSLHSVIYRYTHAARSLPTRHFLRLDQPSVITLAWWRLRMKADSCDASMDGGTRLNP